MMAGVGIAAGSLAALFLWELALRPFAGQLRAPPWPNVACDSVNGAVVATRQFEEGLALARYSECGARLTGNPEEPSASYVVLLGDSHVAAREVNDAQTMGARLEAIARVDERPVNVRQYGWRGASPTQYMLVANEVLRKWNPRHVVVVVADDDLGADVLEGLPPVLHRAKRSGKLELDRKAVSVPRPAAEAKSLALGSLVERRWTMLLARAPSLVRRAVGPMDLDVDPHGDDRVIPDVPDAVVRLLAQAYGDRLVVLYLADIRVTGGDSATTKEALLLKACETQRARCLSTRPAMLAARTAGQAVRGSPTTIVGIGHLNPAGHDLAAREIWAAIR
jgi:hypothetical protein